jgi:type IV pilus assembly protein PilW
MHTAPQQRGMTLIELMVALALGILISLAAAASLLVARQGFSTVDATAQLRDNARYATDVLQRVVVQAAFKDVANAVNQGMAQAQLASAAVNPPPDVQGFNNAVVNLTTPLPVSNGNRDATSGGCSSSSDTACVNGSDVLVVRYEPAQATSNTASTAADGAMVNCAGQPETTASLGPVDDRIVNIIHVGRTSNGEPALLCTYQSSGSWVTRPIVEGVESFQLLFASNESANTLSTGNDDNAPDRYRRGDELEVAGNAAATNAKWRKVRMVRVGMVLRGPANSAQDRSATRTLYPLGKGLASASDAGTSFTAPADGRLRRVVTFTLNLHNSQ